jgi:hypothetical protein
MCPNRRLRLDVASVASEILVSIVRCLFRIAPLLLAGLFMAGCAPSHYSKGISSFAAAAPALDKLDASYTAVNDVHTCKQSYSGRGVCLQIDRGWCSTGGGSYLGYRLR